MFSVFFGNLFSLSLRRSQRGHWLLFFFSGPWSKTARLHGFQVQHGVLHTPIKSLPPKSPILQSSTIQPHLETNLLRLLSLAGLSATGLLGRSILLGELGATDGADTGNGLLAEISTVVVLSSLVGNTLVDPEEQMMISTGL